MARRAAGEGSLHKRNSDGMWVGSIDVGFATDGTRRRKTVYAKTQNAARLRLDELRAAQAAGKPITPEYLTVADLMDQWLESVRPPVVRHTSHRNYEAAIRLHLRPALGNIRARKLTTRDVDRALRQFRDEGLSAARVSTLRTVLAMALKDGMRNDVLSKNVAALSRSPEVKPPKVVAMSLEEAAAILSALEQSEYHWIFVVAITTGMRLSEVLGLTWGDINLQERYITITGQIQRQDHVWVRPEPKTDKSERWLAIDELTVQALEAQRKAQLEQRLLAGQKWKNEMDLVFTRKYGQPMYGTTVNSALKRTLAGAGLRVIHFHELRHAFATLMLAQGVSLKVIQTNLGHASLAITSGIYAHVLPELQRDAASALDGALRDRLATVVATVGGEPA